MAGERGFRRPPERGAESPGVEAPPFVDPRFARNQVRAGVAGVFAQASTLYQQLSQLSEADLPLPGEAADFLSRALEDFAHFHDSVGGFLGELAPSHHDRDLFPKGGP
jgi:hypothetical protein